MKSSRKIACGLLLAVVVLAVRGPVRGSVLSTYISDLVAGTALQNALFRMMNLPGGAVAHERPALEARSQLDGLVRQQPRDRQLYAIKALEDERAGDYATAELDWKQAAAVSASQVEAQAEALADLADFYGRRGVPSKGVSTLLQLAALPREASERFTPDTAQKQWKALTAAVKTADDALLPPERHVEIYEAWVKRYPRDVEPYRAYLEWALGQKDRVRTNAVAARLKAAFPDDLQLAITTDAELAALESGEPAALAVYDKAFSPLWPESLRSRYFAELMGGHQLRVFLAHAQTQAAANPEELAPVLRIFFYYEQQNRKDVADQQLLQYLTRRVVAGKQWTAPELLITAQLFERVQDYDNAASAYYSTYQLAAATATDKEAALAALISLLLDVPEQPLRFGARDLSLYKNVAQMDRHPGFLNGVLSLFLNTTFPETQYQSVSQAGVTYFHRAAASRLLEIMRREFPHSRRTPELEAKLFSAYAAYGQADAVIRFVPGWLDANGENPEYVNTAMLLADAYAQTNDSAKELELYDRLLLDLGAKSEHMPIGQAGVLRAEADHMTVRSPEYVRVLDRYVSRLVQLSRPMDALKLLRREIDRNPDDPGLYERLALFVEQNRLDGDLELTYKQALAHFHDTSWADKLARFYLRAKRRGDYETLARQVTDTFRGTQVAAFLSGIGVSSPVLYRQVNLYAHQRFPQNLAFVKNLVRAYRASQTANPAEYAKLLRQYWFYENDLRTLYFQWLSSNGELQSTLAALPDADSALKDGNVAALQLRAEGKAWLTGYESAAPGFVKLAQLSPGDRKANDRAISIERSLATTDERAFASAIRLAVQDTKAAPQDREAVTRVGEIYADRELYAKAKPYWNYVAATAPGVASGYLDSATVFWDYFQYDDALRVIREGRLKLQQPDLFGYEMGAIYENKDQPGNAVGAYVKAALGGNAEARNRLLTLSRREGTDREVDRQTSALLANGFNQGAFELRLAVLEKRNLRPEIETFLRGSLPIAGTTSELDQVRAAAERLGFDDVDAEALQKTAEITVDPVEKFQARLDLARFYETHDQQAKAESEFSSLLTQNPDLLGVIRAAVNYYWRERQQSKAIATLVAAADRAQQPYQDSFRREAAHKASEAGEYVEARQLLDRLLSGDPYNGDLLAQKAATYSGEKNTSGLLGFYAATLQSLKSSQLPSQDKSSRIAALRRGYIPALIAQQQYQDALEQYQLLLNAYPEDESLATEIARFAETHQLASRVVGYYAKAAQDSPRDYRWPLVVARLDTALRDFPEAIAAYDKAAYVRPDRSDILLAKVDLETRLLRFEDGHKTYSKIYELSYHDPQYLADEAGMQERMGKSDEALRLLRAAYIDPHPQQPSGYLSVMQQLAVWRRFVDVDRIYQEARPILTADSKASVIRLEVEALTMLRRPAEALRLIAAGVTDTKDGQPETKAAGETVKEYFTPEEKADLSAQIERGKLPAKISALTLAQAGGLKDVELKELLKEPAKQWREIQRLQLARLQFDQLGHELEQLARAIEDPERNDVLNEAFQAYASAGDSAGELRLRDYGGSEFARLFVSAHGDIASLSRLDPERAYSVLNYLFTNGAATVAKRAIAAAGQARPAIWTESYTALAGLYFLTPEPWGGQAFDSVLGSRTVGAELTNKSPQESLENGAWFYYGARYGEYLTYRHAAGADDLMAASLESNAKASDGYVELGDSYRDFKLEKKARQAYEYALQLSPKRADVYDDLAVLAMDKGETSQAVANLKRGFELLAERVEQGSLPPSYWQTATELLQNMNRYRLTPQLRPDADLMLRAYIKRNGNYQFSAFLAAMFHGVADPKAVEDWAIELSRLDGMNGIIDELLASTWIQAGEKDILYVSQIEHARKTIAEAAGDAVPPAREELLRQQTAYATYLDGEKRWADAWAILQQIQPAADRPNQLVLIAGAMSGHLNQLFEQYAAKPDTAPGAEDFLGAALSLKKENRGDLALTLQEYEYTRELKAGGASASSWFGLARVRFEQKRDPEALTLIHAVALSVGAPFENLAEAIHLLEGVHLTDQAIRYAAEWQAAEPWNPEARLAAARLQQDKRELNALRESANTPYAIRVEAAHVLRDMDAPIPGSDELDLLTNKSVSPKEAEQAFFVAARLDAAKTADSDGRVKLLGEAIALAPELREPRLDLAEAALMLTQDAYGLAVLGIANNLYSPELVSLREIAPAKYLNVMKQAAQALERRGDYELAVNLYDQLLQEPTAAAGMQNIKTARDIALGEQNLMTLNATRQPFASKDVEQNHVVKPKLASLPGGVAE